MGSGEASTTASATVSRRGLALGRRIGSAGYTRAGDHGALRAGGGARAGPADPAATVIVSRADDRPPAQAAQAERPLGAPARARAAPRARAAARRARARDRRRARGLARRARHAPGDARAGRHRLPEEGGRRAGGDRPRLARSPRLARGGGGHAAASPPPD